MKNKINRIYILIYSIINESKKQLATIWVIVTALMTFTLFRDLFFHLKVKVFTTQMQRHLITSEIVDMPYELTAGKTLDFYLYSHVLIGVLFIAGMLVCVFYKSIKKTNLPHKALIPATIGEKYSANVISSFVGGGALIGLSFIVTSIILKSIFSIKYGVDLIFKQENAFTQNGEFVNKNTEILLRMNHSFILFLLAGAVILTIYNSSTKETYKSIIRTVLIIVFGFISMIYLLKIDIEIQSVLSYVLYPAIAIGAWIFSAYLFKNREIKN